MIYVFFESARERKRKKPFIAVSNTTPKKSVTYFLKIKSAIGSDVSCPQGIWLKQKNLTSYSREL